MSRQRPIHESFLQSISSPHLLDLGVDAAEFTLDSILDSDVLQRIPLVGSIAKLYGAAKTIRERFMLKKLYRFFGRLAENMSQEEREIALQRIRSEPDRAKEVGEAFVVWLDRLDEEYKAELLAKVFELYARGVIDFDRSSRFAAVIERAHVPFLLSMGSSQRPPGYPSLPGDEAVRSHMFSLGLLSVRADLHDLDHELARGASRRNISLVRFELNDDGRVFKEYVLDEMPVRTRISVQIHTPSKGPRKKDGS